MYWAYIEHDDTAQLCKQSGTHIQPPRPDQSEHNGQTYSQFWAIYLHKPFLAWILLQIHLNIKSVDTDFKQMKGARGRDKTRCKR
jgi:hypothetical protein